MIEKNALEWLDMGEGLEKLDIYKNKKLVFIYTFFRVLLKENNFSLYFYIILQSIIYFQLCCISFGTHDNKDYSNDYLIYIMTYISKIFLPQRIINNINSYRIIMIVITILLIFLFSGFFIIIAKMNNDKLSNFVKKVVLLVNFFLQIILHYLIGPIIVICLFSFKCSNGYNNIIASECLTKGKNIIFVILAIINIIFYSIITIFFSIFYKEIGKIGEYTPKIQIDTNFELFCI